jgi:regulator of protease activity HflC (stomatin/prohibitin superfamily)
VSFPRTIALIVSGVVVFAALVTGCSTFGTVPSGSVGVVTRFGATTGEAKQPGLFVIVPFVSGVEMMDTQTHPYKATAEAASKDLQNVTTEVTVTIKLNPDGAVSMFNTMRRDYSDRLVHPSIQEAVKAVTARYNAEELVTKREEVRAEIETMLKERFASHNLSVDQVAITNFAFSKDFAAAIEAKVVATQLALAAENRVKEAKFTADSAIETAKGQAEAIRIQAEAIQQQGGAAYVQLQAIAKWDGSVPQWITGGNQVPFINLTPPAREAAK